MLGLELRWNPRDPPASRKLLNLLACLGRDDAHISAGLQQTLKLLRGDRSRADHNTPAAIELYEHGEQRGHSALHAVRHRSSGEIALCNLGRTTGQKASNLVV